jgi:hypothetical protein
MVQLNNSQMLKNGLPSVTGRDCGSSVLVDEIETNTNGGKYMTTTFLKNDPAKALQYFEDKMAFTAGPIDVPFAALVGQLAGAFANGR